MQLASKMRFVSAQFVALLSDDLWRTNAEHANRMAKRLAEGVAGDRRGDAGLPGRGQRGVRGAPPDVTEALQQHFPFYVWDEATGVVRWMASFDTTAEDVDALVALSRCAHAADGRLDAAE